MSEFAVTDEKIAHISDQFSVNKRGVEFVYKLFSKVIGGVKNQYLAHIIRCMESYIRKETGNPMFQINTFPMDPDSPVLNVGCAQYYPKRYFSIFFHPRMDEKQLRVCLAHELGHLFIIELANEGIRGESEPLDKTALTEPLSSIFGIFTIMDKNQFYKEIAPTLNHHSWKEIVRAFVHLQDKIMKNPGASSWVSSLDRKFIILAGSIPQSENRFTTFSVVVNFPEQAPGYGPGLPIN